MRLSKRLAVLGMAILGVYLGMKTDLCASWAQEMQDRLDSLRMRNVQVTEPLPEESASPLPAANAAPAAATLNRNIPAGEADMPEPSMEPAPAQEIRETTISGGLSIKNETGYAVDVSGILREGPSLRLPADNPQILIIHTHGSEAYTQAGLDRYEANDNSRTADTRYNIVRVGDELTKLLEGAGLQVLHDRGIYDYPSYTGSYTRSGEAIRGYLEAYPSICMVLDVHRDALGADDVVYKTMAEEDGTVASQIMLLVGTDDSGLEHPNWRGNLALALYLQEAVGRKHPTLMRPVALVRERYNQHLTPGSLILEVGSSGNTLQEALSAIRLFAEAAGPALAALVETESQG